MTFFVNRIVASVISSDEVIAEQRGPLSSVTGVLIRQLWEATEGGHCVQKDDREAATGQDARV